MPHNLEDNSLRSKTEGFSDKIQSIYALASINGGLRGIWRRATGEVNEECRQFFLASDISQAQIVILLLALIIGLFVISDYMILGFSLFFYVLVALRLALVVFSGLEYLYIKGLKSYKSYDQAVFIYLLIITIGILIINATRPQNFLPHIIVIDVAVFIFYLVLSTRFIFQLIPSLIISLGELALILLTFQWFMAAGLTTALLSLIFTNVIAALVSLQLHSYRSQIFQSVSKRKETDRLAAIGQTAGMIGHDIRNPLQAIVSELYITRSSVEESSLPSEFKASVTESIQLIEEQTDYISKIVSDLQDYARPIKPEYKEIDLAKLLVSVFQTVRIPDGIELKVDVQGFPEISTDPTLMRRAITNLINNAIQAMPEGGVLKLAAHKTGDVVVISVSDTGKGIPEEVKAKLFTPLVTTKAKGQGLGLAVVKRLVEALDGKITFDSQPGQGTIFTIELPSRPLVTKKT